MKIFLLPALIFMWFFNSSLSAQNDIINVTTEERKLVLDSITSILERDYVFSDVAMEMNAFVKKRFNEGAYNKVTDPFAFGQILTSDLQQVSNDRHLRVRFEPENIANRRNAAVSESDSIMLAQRRLKQARSENYGFKKVEILEGNIGYLELTAFFGVDEEAGATAQAAMNLLSNADALIIDLRQNGGGSPQMIQLISSYLFGPNRVHLNNFYNRPQNNQTQTWTLPYVPGKRRPDMDVYVLTSSYTFSAAEEFSYNLKNLERATLVGETTGGGAHPGGTRIATDRFTIWVPDGRAINPITNTNWEGVGVKPHIEVAAKEALAVTTVKALEKLLEDGDEDGRYQLRWALDGIKAKNAPISLDPQAINSITGTYGPRKIYQEDGKLYYQREGRSPYELTPMSKERFMIKEIPDFRIRMEFKHDKAESLVGQYRDGRTDRNLRTKE